MTAPYLERESMKKFGVSEVFPAIVARNATINLEGAVTSCL